MELLRVFAGSCALPHLDHVYYFLHSIPPYALTTRHNEVYTQPQRYRIKLLQGTEVVLEQLAMSYGELFYCEVAYIQYIAVFLDIRSGSSPVPWNQVRLSPREIIDIRLLLHVSCQYPRLMDPLVHASDHVPNKNSVSGSYSLTQMYVGLYCTVFLPMISPKALPPSPASLLTPSPNPSSCLFVLLRLREKIENS